MIVDATLHGRKREDGPRHGNLAWPFVIFSGIHMINLAPLITAISLAALFSQLRQLRDGTVRDTNALSVEGLGLQAVVFFVVALCWPFRFYMPPEVPWGSWYQLVGWAAVDNGLFALVQAVLYVVARRKKRSIVGDIQTAAGESAPLLAE